jgi:hypothetical protein
LGSFLIVYKLRAYPFVFPKINECSRVDSLCEQIFCHRTSLRRDSTAAQLGFYLVRSCGVVHASWKVDTEQAITTNNKATRLAH